MRAALAAVLLALAALPGAAQSLLAPDEAAREIAIEFSGGRVFLPAVVASSPGVMMFDTGTADAIFLNRDAVALPEGQVLGRGLTASGQWIEVRGHPAPPIVLAGRAAGLQTVRSGNFGFVQDQLRPDFLGFAGAGLLEGVAFQPDLDAGVLRLWRSDALPKALRSAHVWQPMGRVPGGLPRLEGRIGGAAIAVELDSGDGGTLYLTEARAAALRAAGRLIEGAEGAVLRDFTVAGQPLTGFALRLVMAGGPEDHRETDTDMGAGDAVRLGAGFIAACGGVWDFGANRLGLRPCGGG
jgi:hypothetical protein